MSPVAGWACHGQKPAFLTMIHSLLPVQPLTSDIHETGLTLAERYELSIYDGMIAASALHADCDTLWPEGMQDRLALHGRLRVVHPFRVQKCYETQVRLIAR